MCKINGAVYMEEEANSTLIKAMRPAFGGNVIRFSSANRILVDARATMTSIYGNLQFIADTLKLYGVGISPKTRLVITDEENVMTVAGYTNGKWTWSTMEEDVLKRASVEDLSHAISERPEFSGIDPLRILNAFKAYVRDDLDSGADNGYMVTTLTEKCGLTENEVKTLGFNEVFD